MPASPPQCDVAGVFLESRLLNSIFTLIVDTVASVLGGVLLLRFWMQIVRVRPPAPISQFCFQLTDWMVHPLRRLIPGMGGYDWASLLGAFVVVTLSVAAGLMVANGLSLENLLVLSVLRLLEWVLYGFMGLIIIEAIFSWVNPSAPLAPFVRALTDPLMRPLRRVVPLIGSIDLSALIALLLLQIALRVLTLAAMQLF